jgi:hypothetical protein
VIQDWEPDRGGEESRGRAQGGARASARSGAGHSDHQAWNSWSIREDYPSGNQKPFRQIEDLIDALANPRRTRSLDANMATA